MLAALEITRCLMKYRCCLHWARSRGSQVLKSWVLLVLILGWGGKAQGQELVITEFVADADFGLADEEGELQDWIELYNPKSVEVSLAGWHLTDDVSDLARWRFPAGTICFCRCDTTMVSRPISTEYRWRKPTPRPC
jgi:hypothetical protein